MLLQAATHASDPDVLTLSFRALSRISAHLDLNQLPRNSFALPYIRLVQESLRAAMLPARGTIGHDNPTADCLHALQRLARAPGGAQVLMPSLTADTVACLRLLVSPVMGVLLRSLAVQAVFAVLDVAVAAGEPVSGATAKLLLADSGPLQALLAVRLLSCPVWFRTFD